MVQIGAISTKKGAQKGVDHARNGQPLPLTRCARDEVGQLLCVEFAKEPTKCHRFARRSLGYELQAHGFGPPFYFARHASVHSMIVAGAGAGALQGEGTPNAVALLEPHIHRRRALPTV